MSVRTWKVGELIDKLHEFDRGSEVCLVDADTSWYVTSFDIGVKNNVVMLFPSDYDEMESTLGTN